MLFSRHLDKIRNCSELLKSFSGAGNEHLLVRAALSLLASDPALFDKCVSKHNPFLHEFLDHIDFSDPDHVPDVCFNLLECLAVIFREKELRMPYVPQQPEERDLLRYFEQCGEWLPDDEHMVSHWYWRHLPEQFGAPRHSSALH